MRLPRRAVAIIFSPGTPLPLRSPPTRRRHCRWLGAVDAYTDSELHFLATRSYPPRHFKVASRAPMMPIRRFRFHRVFAEAPAFIFSRWPCHFRQRICVALPVSCHEEMHGAARVAHEYDTSTARPWTSPRRVRLPSHRLFQRQARCMALDGRRRRCRHISSSAYRGHARALTMGRYHDKRHARHILH